MTTFSQRIRGLFACLALLGLVVAFPAVLIAIGLAPWDADLGEFRRMLTRPDDGSLAYAAFAAVGWGAWVVVTGSVSLAAIAEVRRVPAPSLPGFALPQQFAAQMVGAAALLFAAAPASVAVLSSLPAHSIAAVAAECPTPPAQPAITLAPVEPDGATLTADKPKTTAYTVARGDSLWRIAERLLGDGARFPELVALNADVLNGRPGFIDAGTVLRVPIAEPSKSGTVVVEPGDTLSEIAEQELGDASRYPEIFEASRATEQPGGTHLKDPDLILPGWELTIPHAVEPIDLPDDQAIDVPPPIPHPPIVEEPKTGTPAPTVEPTEPVAESAPAVADVDDPAADGAPAWLLPGVAGAGLLAGAVLMAVRAHRRTQLRYRRPGQTLAPNPPDLIKIDKTAAAYGDRVAYDIDGLDAALNNIAAHSRDTDTPLPVLTAIALSRGVATFHFAERTDLADPWKGEDRCWQIELGTADGDDDVLPPYPMLVSIGRDDSRALWLVDLESLGSVALTGDRDHALAFARHAAAELALNPWSVLVQTDTFDIGDELGDLDTLRLRTHNADDAAVDSVTAEIQDAWQGLGDEPDPWHLVITADVDFAAVVGAPRAQSVGRSGVAVVTVNAPPADGATVLEFTPTGRVKTPTMGVDVVAAGLTTEEATLCAAIVDVTRVTPTTDIPNFGPAVEGWRSVADQAGALRTEFTRPRLVGSPDATSLLPEQSDAYVAVSATTENDISELAPGAVEHASRTVTDLDPTLDDDVTAWLDENARLPRLVLLGPVRVTAHGNMVDQIVKRRPYYEELLAFVALHPEGVNSRRIAETFHIGQSRARTDIGYLREWLGNDPRTGGWHIPRQSEVPKEDWRGYQVDGLLVDVDLFRRLRARGQARGVEGMADLVRALHLVSGTPFAQLRDQGWNWLLDGDRLQDLIPCAIVDTAHIVVLDALQRADLDLARDAAETGCAAAPYDEVSRLDLAKVMQAQGHLDTADQMLRKDVFDRRDDYEPPVDLPARTKEIVKNNGWGQRRPRPVPKPGSRPTAS